MTPTMPELLAERFPALAKYAPHLSTISQQQALFLLLDCDEAFYGGAAGGGKSDALLMAALQYADIPGYSALILRRTFPELTGADGLIPRSHEWFAGTDAVWNEQRKTWRFPSGAVLEFGHVQTEQDKHKYQGRAYTLVALDELTSFSESIYEYIAFSRTRRPKTGAISKVPIRVRSTGNPGGIGHMWVKDRFITKRKEGVAFIPARVADNPGLDVAEYKRTMSHLSDALQAQLLDGDWGAFEGAALPKFGDPHLIDEFPLEDAHTRFEACDYGLNGTAWALWPVDYEGNLIAYDSICVSDLIPSQVALFVIAKRKGEWGMRHRVFADPSLWHRTGGLDKWGRPAMLADEFTDHGVRIEPANNDPRAGLIRLRELIEPDPRHPFPDWHPRRGEFGAPRLFVVAKRCPELVEQLRAAPLQPIDRPDAGEKIDPEWEGRHGHFSAMARYAVMSRYAPSEKPEEEPADARTVVLRRSEKRIAEGKYPGDRAEECVYV